MFTWTTSSPIWEKPNQIAVKQDRPKRSCVRKGVVNEKAMVCEETHTRHYIGDLLDPISYMYLLASTHAHLRRMQQHYSIMRRNRVRCPRPIFYSIFRVNHCVHCLRLTCFGISDWPVDLRYRVQPSTAGFNAGECSTPPQNGYWGQGPGGGGIGGCFQTTSFFDHLFVPFFSFRHV